MAGVRVYLKRHYLKDPDSYEGISWEAFGIYNKDNNTYFALHKYRAYNVSIDILSKVTSALGFVIDIKVDSSVCPTHFSQRKPVKLVIGEDYYVSFGNNEAHRCKLVDIPEMYQGQRIKIETPTPRGSITHILFADEIGTTPDEAVMNQVTM